MTRAEWILLAATLMVPAVVVLRFLLEVPAWAVFVAGGVAISVLAEWMRRATEQIALRVGPSLGGLLNVSFGSAAELILALFVIAGGHVDVVRAQITGSIIGTSLLGLGLACLAGGWSIKRQTFSRDRAGLLASLLTIVVVALLLPAVFHLDELHRALPSSVRHLSERSLSVGVAIVLLALYAGNLVFTLVTHRDVFSDGETGGKPRWSLLRSISTLVVATLAVAGCAELVSDALQATAATLHLPLLFVGVVPLALIGTAADLFAAVSFARKGQMELVVSICIGSSIQVGLVVAPLLVLISLAMGQPMSLVFPSVLDLFAIASAVVITKSIAADGETNWFEGLMLVGVYALLALAFFFVEPG